MDLSFSIAVESAKSENELLEMLAKTVPHAKREKGYIRINENALKFEENPDHDSTRCEDIDSGWEYYRYDCDIFPVQETSLQVQIELAKLLIDQFSKVGAKTYLLAEFDSSPPNLGST